METMVAEVEGFLRRYGAALGTGDVAGVGRCWQVPALVVADQGARAVLAMEEVEAFFAAAVAWYRDQGLVSTVPEVRRVERLSTGLVSVDATRSAQDAGGVERSREVSRYIMRRDEDGTLRICVAVTVTE
jgi:ketosteroid isomerase-like protein